MHDKYGLVLSIMKKVFRHEENCQYWDRRWSEAGHDLDHFVDLSIYPIKYAEMIMDNPALHSVELGAGLGRLLKHYYYGGHQIVGLERSQVAVERLKTENPDLEIRVGDVLNLPYADEEFDTVLAFGLYHNIESGMNAALAETSRCLKVGGRFCISMRPNNFEMHINEWYWKWNQRGQPKDKPTFHKWLVNPQEFRKMLLNHGLHTNHVHLARNVSLLYRFPWFREHSGDEAERRAKGYRLNAVGRAIDRIIVSLLPYQFCNVLVFIGHKDE